MRTFPPTRPDPLLERIENLETSLRQISDIFAPLSNEFNICKLYVTKKRRLRVLFETKSK